MKTLITLVLIAFSLSMTAQEMAAVRTSMTSYSNPIPSVENTVRQVKKEQISDIVDQIYTHLAKSLDFSILNGANEETASVTLEVRIDSNKNVDGFKISRSDNDLLKAYVNQAMKSMQKIYLAEDLYVGPKRINIPFRFSL